MWGLLLDAWLTVFVGLVIGGTAGNAFAIFLFYRGKPELASVSARLRVALPIAAAPSYMILVWFL